MLPLVGTKESEEIVIRRINRRLERFFGEWEKRIQADPTGLAFPAQTSSEFPAGATVTQEGAFPQQRSGLGMGSPGEVPQESAFGTEDYTQIKPPPNSRSPLQGSPGREATPIVLPPAMLPVTPAQPEVPLSPPSPVVASVSPPPPPSGGAAGAQGASMQGRPKSQPPPMILAPVHPGRGPQTDSPMRPPINGPSMNIPSMNITPPVPPVIPPGMVAPGAMPAVAPFSEFPASQIFGVAPLPRRVGRVPSLFLNPFFYVAFLLAVAGLLFIHHLLGGEEFLP